MTLSDPTHEPVSDLMSQLEASVQYEALGHMLDILVKARAHLHAGRREAAEREVTRLRAALVRLGEQDAQLGGDTLQTKRGAQ